MVHVSLQRRPLGQNRQGGLLVALQDGTVVPVHDFYRLFMAILAGEDWHNISELDAFAGYLDRQAERWLTERVGRPFQVAGTAADYLSVLAR